MVENQDNQILTDVTNVAEQEMLSDSVMLPKMSDDELCKKLIHQFPILLRRLELVVKKAKAKDIRQGFIGALDLPLGNVPVKWVDSVKRAPKPEFKDTVEIFELTQNLIISRLTISQQDWLKAIKPQLVEELKNKLGEIQKESENV